ncbi:acyl carrier protein [Ramlibacter terrae]|uniref:Acyl carrier protein n=1 Tax=Ramlibacter terrae TaxID=2732511 RepID=A0ABX6P281_9BURK|nr:acyl carrier protein [Ramlibacter terrae]
MRSAACKESNPTREINSRIELAQGCTPEHDRSPLPGEDAPVASEALLREVADLVVKSLNLEVAPADIQPDEPLYGDGLGLDSIDILEVAPVVSKQYGLQLRADHEDNTKIFSSLRSLADHIAAQRTV